MSRKKRTALIVDVERQPGPVVPLPADKIVKSSFKIRLLEQGIGELAVSIRRQGLLHPIVVRPSGQVFELVAGHRRFEACRLLGWKEVPCLVRNLSDKEAYELALTENVQRESIDAVEEAEAYRRYVNHFGWGSVGELARKIGKSHEYVSHRILLLRLPSEILEKVRTREMTPWQAQELVWLRDSSLVTRLSSSIARHKLTVKQIRDVRKKIRDGYGVGDAVSRVILDSGYRGVEELTEAYKARCLNRCIKDLGAVASALDKAIEKASLHQDEDFVTFLADKRSVVQRLTDDLCEERQKHISNDRSAR